MIRIATATALSLTVALLALSILLFVWGWWPLGIVSVILTVFAGLFTAAGMSIIALDSLDD